MAQDTISPGMPNVGETPPGPPHIPIPMLAKNFGVQVLLGFLLGVVALVVMNAMGTEAGTARGAAVIVALLGLWSARSFVHWPIPHDLLKAQAQLPAGVKASESGGRDVLETVAFVIVLVLILKSFAAEAFVIPTGSMAPTLYGDQKIVECPSCGIKFPVNSHEEVDPKKNVPVLQCTCQNCRQPIQMIPRSMDREPNPSKELVADGRRYREIRDPGPTTGDRVVVGKFLYDGGLPGFSGPDRFDVVVFKFPKGPQEDHSPLNYIKRLIGLSGETIGIHGGDLYVLSPENSPKYEDSNVEAKDKWKRESVHTNDPAALKKWDAGEFRILRKSPRVMQAMMRLVYDNDHLPEDLAKSKLYQRWQPQSESWETLDEGRAFRHGHTADAGREAWLRYRHVLRGDEGKPSLITDFLSYNTNNVWAPDSKHKGNWVGDLAIECEVKVEKAEGELMLELVRCGERFRATWDLASDDGSCKLTRHVAGRTIDLDVKPTALRKGTYKLRFANVDQRLTVWVDHSLPFGDGVSYDPPTNKGPGREDLEPAAVGIKGSAVAFSHLKLHRDIYYTSGAKRKDGELRADDSISPFDTDVENWTDPNAWGPLRELGVRTMYVQPRHYLCLGDNSTSSSDSRDWGLVPERLMLGRALLVYWPFSRAGRIR